MLPSLNSIECVTVTLVGAERKSFPISNSLKPEWNVNEAADTVVPPVKLTVSIAKLLALSVPPTERVSAFTGLSASMVSALVS